MNILAVILLAFLANISYSAHFSWERDRAPFIHACLERGYSEVVCVRDPDFGRIS